jgi:hypothetical protein
MTSIVFALDKLSQEKDGAMVALDRLEQKEQLSSEEKEKLRDIVEKEFTSKSRVLLKQVAHYERELLRVEAVEQSPQSTFRPHTPLAADAESSHPAFVITPGYTFAK